MIPAIPPPATLYEVRADSGCVVIDTADAALARLLELISRRPHLLAALADATDARLGRCRHDAITALRDDPDVRAACVLRLDVDDALDLVTAVTAAASPPARGRPAPPVGAGADRVANPPQPGRTPR